MSSQPCLDERALELLNDLPYWDIGHRTSLYDLFVHDGIHLWWIIHPFVSRDFLLVFRSVLLQGGGRRAEAGVLERVPGWPLRLASDPLLSLKLSGAGMAGEEDRWFGIRLGKYRAQAALFGWLIEMGFDLGIPAGYRFRALRARSIGVSRLQLGPSPRCLVVTHTRTWGELGWGVRGDVVLEPVIERLRAAGYSVVGIEADYSPVPTVATLRERSRTGSWLPYERFYNVSAQRVYRRCQAEFSTWGDRIVHSEPLRKHLQINGVDCSRRLEARRRLMAARLAPHAARLISISRTVLESIRPDVLLLAYETGPVGRAMTAAARMRGIPTIAVQHGRIHRLHHHYVQKSPEEEDPRAARLLPDVTAVYGEEVRQILLRYGGYPDEGVRVTGQPRTDVLVRGRESFRRRSFLEQLGFSADKPLLFVATQNFPRVEDRLRVLEILLGRTSDLTGWQVLIKPHPGETDGLVERYLKGVDATVVRVRSDVDLYSSLSAADVVATGTSTVGIEALLFRKPVITVGGLPQPLDLAERGAALEVNSPSEFVEALVRLERDREFAMALAARASEYVERHFHRLDGRASDRVVELIDELVERRGTDR